jgi:DNA adenine methylase
MSDRIVNVTAVPHRSPFRYPGGKTWLVPRIRRWLTSLPTRPRVLVEPFAGGAIVGLSATLEGLVEHGVLIERDADVAAVWEAILGGQALDLAARIVAFEVNEANVRAVLAREETDVLARAFRTILRNRMQRGGIMAPGASLMKQGEKGRGLTSRWYPETLRRRLVTLHEWRDRFTFHHGDGLRYLAAHGDEDAVWFLDPPYTVAGRRLYAHADLEHEKLFRLAVQLRGPFLMTYDDHPAIRALAVEFGLETQTIAMKNTHHAVMSELLVGRDLGWVRSV